MRLWTVHPKHLDGKGLVALWREGLLALKVLRGKTRGYVHHPQLLRFRKMENPAGSMVAYLRVVRAEAGRRGYVFDRRRLGSIPPCSCRIPETHGQLLYEWRHLKRKVRARDKLWWGRIRREALPEAHPLFRLVSGGVRDWERQKGNRKSRLRSPFRSGSG